METNTSFYGTRYLCLSSCPTTPVNLSFVEPNNTCEALCTSKRFTVMQDITYDNETLNVSWNECTTFCDHAFIYVGTGAS
jgi:hypothetical protein